MRYKPHTKEQFVQKSKDNYEDEFHYHNTVYVNERTPLIITCPEHGDFKQTPKVHLRCRKNKRKTCCPKCNDILIMEQFIQRSIKKYGDRFDYSKVVYVDYSTKVTIICKQHGEFEQSPKQHDAARGCPGCRAESYKRKWSSERFIQKSIDMYGDIFEYKKTVYTNVSTVVIITCPEHGDFKQIPNTHLSDDGGCPRCRDIERQNRMKIKYIQKSIDKFGDRFDYSKVDYNNSSTPVTIICKQHGEFKYNLYMHSFTKTGGCPGCLDDHNNQHTKTTDEFITDARDRWGDQFDYSKVVYRGVAPKIIVICPKHGEFLISPKKHLEGRACPRCDSGGNLIQPDDFIEKCIGLYGDQFDYTKTVYRGSVYNIIITCHEHGDFEIKAGSHVAGKGCPVCHNNSSKGEQNIERYLDDNNIPFYKEQTFPDCININRLRFDFYLPQHNVCVEFDGEQHFKPIDWFGGETQLKYIQHNDNIKNTYCYDCGIHLIRIPYTEYENIPNILDSDILKK